MLTPLFYSRKDLVELGFRFSRATLHRKIKDGSFPRPVKLGENINAWPSAVIHAYADQLAAAQDSEAK
jgi:predicted DNA-binding transcriptional regulator AlpA